LNGIGQKRQEAITTALICKFGTETRSVAKAIEGKMKNAAPMQRYFPPTKPPRLLGQYGKLAFGCPDTGTKGQKEAFEPF
jgi:hypothetical protein